MTTLFAAPVAPTLDRLFAAQASRAAPLLPDLPREERARLLASKTEYKDFYARLKDEPLAVSRETGVLLYMLARATTARAVVEFGTSFGVSTIHLAAALRDNGGGTLIGSEFEPSKIERARANLAAAGLLDLVDLRVGDALETLARDLPETIDLLLLDGAKSLYGDILDRVEARLRVGSLIVADNADMNPNYLARVRARDSGYLSVAFAEDVEVSMRLSRSETRNREPPPIP